MSAPRSGIHPTAYIGELPESREWDATTMGYGIHPVIHPEARIEAYCTVDAGTERATSIGARSWLLKGCHVGHDAIIGDDCELAPHCSVGGHVTIGNGVRVGQGALFKPYVTVGDGARIGMGAVGIRDGPADDVLAGNPAHKLASK